MERIVSVHDLFQPQMIQIRNRAAEEPTNLSLTSVIALT